MGAGAINKQRVDPLAVPLAGKTVHKFWDKETSLEREVMLTERELLADAKVRLYRSPSHFQDFVDCLRSRRRPICDVEIG